MKTKSEEYIDNLAELMAHSTRTPILRWPNEYGMEYEAWGDVVNRHGGDVTIVHLPGIGIRGNTHFLMSDLNNLEIADQMSRFLEKKGLN